MANAPGSVGSPPPDAFRSAVDDLFWSLNDRFLAETREASQLTDDTVLDFGYYARHRIETIKRIRMTAYTDALALAAMIRADYDSARIWARYACEELDHDRMFHDDLERHGISRSFVDSVPCLPATTALGDFLEQEIAEHGALPAVAYSLFVEWNSERFSRAAVEKARRAYGDDCVRGSSDHLLVDEGEDHVSEMLVLAERMTAETGVRGHLFRLVERIAELFRQYFSELSAFRGWIEPPSAHDARSDVDNDALDSPTGAGTAGSTVAMPG